MFRERADCEIVKPLHMSALSKCFRFTRNDLFVYGQRRYFLNGIIESGKRLLGIDEESKLRRLQKKEVDAVLKQVIPPGSGALGYLLRKVIGSVTDMFGSALREVSRQAAADTVQLKFAVQNYLENAPEAVKRLGENIHIESISNLAIVSSSMSMSSDLQARAQSKKQINAVVHLRGSDGHGQAYVSCSSDGNEKRLQIDSIELIVDGESIDIEGGDRDHHHRKRSPRKIIVV